MALSNNDIGNIYDGLIYKFLYKNDPNCIHILLNLYDSEENITNIRPKYVSIYHLKRHINKLLKKRKGNHFISLNLGQLIHEDINRLELFVYLKGYKNAYYNNHWVNKLENLTVEDIPLEQLDKYKYLYHFNINTEKVENLRFCIDDEILTVEKENNSLYNSVKFYCENIIKPKVMSLNKFLDKQLTIEYNSTVHNIVEDYSLLTLDELNNIYNEILKIIVRDSLKLYSEAYWYGLNDRVLKRYR